MTERMFDLNIEEVLENWEPRHAIRELVANALDERALTDTGEVEVAQDADGTWRIRDFGRGLSPEHLTQKENPEKLGKPDKVIGKFGVGLKDALGVLHRRGVEVRIESRHAVISVAMMPKADFGGTRTLHAVVAPARDPGFQGTEVTLRGASSADVDGAKALFLKFSGETELEGTRYGQVLARRPGKPARVYFNGLLVAEDEGFLFSYNIGSPTKAMRDALNRERNNVGRTAFSQRIKDILLACSSDGVCGALGKALERSAPGRPACDELGWLEVSRHACRFLSPSRVVFVTPSQMQDSRGLVDSAIRDGLRVVTVDERLAAGLRGLNDADGNQVRSLHAYARELSSSFRFEWVDEKDLSPKERAVFETRHAIAKLVGGLPREVSQVRISETMRPESDGSDCVGLWIEDEGTIVIRRDQLESIAAFAGTLLHEIAHVVSDAPDVDRDFEEQLTQFLGRIAESALDCDRTHRKRGSAT